MQQGGEELKNWVIATAIVSVNPDFGSSTDLMELLSNHALLASVHHELKPAPVDGERKLIYVQAATVMEGVVSIQTIAPNENGAKVGLDQLLKKLPEFEPAQAASLRRRLESSEKELKHCQAALADAAARREKFIDEHGTLPVGELRAHANDELLQRSRELDETRFRVATESSMRDMLKQMLVNEPALFETRRTIPNSRRILLEQQIQAISQISISPLTEKYPNVDIRQLLSDQQQWVANIEKQLTDATLTDTVIIEKTDNARRAEIERQIFDGDRALAEAKTNETVLAARVAVLRDEAAKLHKLAIEYDAINEEWDREMQNLEEARAAHKSAKTDARSIIQGTWLKVISGPTVKAY